MMSGAAPASDAREPGPLPALHELLREPMADLQQLGALPAAVDDPLQIMKGSQSPVAQLGRVVKQLVPMIDSFRQPPSRRVHWWRRFTGEALERELTYWHACQQLEAVAAEGQRLVGHIGVLRRGLSAEHARMQRHTVWLEQVVATAREALAPAHAGARAAAAFAQLPDYWPRFARRVDNLHALHHAMLLGIEQFKLADAQAQAVLDRHAEVATVLVPLWRQRMGFELFSRQQTVMTE